MPRRFVFALVVLFMLGCAPGCQPATPTILASPTLFPPTAFPATATLLPTVTLEPSPTPTLDATPTLTPTLPARAPTVAPPLACRNASATITSPAMDSHVADIVQVRGTATHPILAYWKVEYRTDGSTNYAMLGNGDTPVTNDILARLSSKTLPNGVYWLRLTVVQKDGNYAVPCEIRVTIANP